MQGGTYVLARNVPTAKFLYIRTVRMWIKFVYQSTCELPALSFWWPEIAVITSGLSW
jgi:hypothetical protein